MTVVADAGMVSAANQKAIEDAGLSFILGARIPDVPYVVQTVAQDPPRQPRSRTGTSSPSPGPPAPTDQRRDQVIYYQYRADRARRTLRGIDEQIAKAEKAVAGKTPVKRNRFVQLTGGDQDASTGPWRPRPAPWPGSRATSPTCSLPDGTRSPPSS